MARLRIPVAFVALVVLANACSSGVDGLTGSWQLVTYVDNGQETVVEEGANTTLSPTFTFDGQYVSGNAGCNNFGADDVLNLGELVKDASECETMTVELFLEDVIWSGADIAVDIANDSMVWNLNDATLTFRKQTGSQAG